jgi:hypothetical protein
VLQQLNPAKHGAKTAADYAVFLIGAAAGGLIDATANFFGFADPLVVAGLAGAGALGLKKAIWDGPQEARRERDRSLSLLRSLELEIELSRRSGDHARADCLSRALETGLAAGSSAENIWAMAQRCDRTPSRWARLEIP